MSRQSCHECHNCSSHVQCRMASRCMSHGFHHSGLLKPLAAVVLIRRHPLNMCTAQPRLDMTMHSMRYRSEDFQQFNFWYRAREAGTSRSDLASHS